MQALALYVILGLLVCGAVALRRDRSREGDELPFAILFDPVWPLILLWPLWLAVVLVERTFLKGPSASPSGAASVPDSTAAIDPVGQLGVVVAALRPLGRIRIGNTHFDARSDGRILEIGTNVRVVARTMTELVVEAESVQSPAPAPARGGTP